MWSQNPSDKEYLQWLKNEVSFAFLQRTGRKLRITQTKENSYAKLLFEDIKKMLKLEGRAEKIPPSVKVLIKFFCTDLENIYPANVMMLEDYVFAVKEEIADRKGISFSSSLHQAALKGVNKIDPVFIERCKSLDTFEYSDFYLGKKEYQWIGVIKNLDEPRKCIEQMTDIIERSFDQCSEEKIAAIITGEPGVGKSTCLRRLAVNFAYEAFRILWVTDPYDFCDISMEQLGESVDDFIVFIEDWDKIASDQHLKNKLLVKLNNLNNIRVVISCNTLDKKDFGHLNKISFRLTNLENIQILKRVAGLNDPWQHSAQRWILSEEINKVSLFIVLYVVNADSVNEDGYVQENNIAVRFQKIINYQLNTINSNNSGLASSLYFLALLHKKHDTYVTFSSLYYIAQYFNANKYVTLTTTTELISNFVSVSDFINPDLIDHKVVSFHHSLVRDAIENSFLDNIKCYTDQTYVDLVELLLANEQTQSALELMNAALSDKEMYFPGWNVRTEQGLRLKMIFARKVFKGFKYFMVGELLTIDRSIEYYYNSARKSGENFWAMAIDFLNSFNFSRNASVIVLEQIVLNGCKERIVLETLEFFKNLNSVKMEDYILTLTDSYSKGVMAKVYQRRTGNNLTIK